MMVKWMTKITPDALVGATVTEVISDGDCIECVKLRNSKGREFELWAGMDKDPDYLCCWIEVL